MVLAFVGITATAQNLHNHSNAASIANEANTTTGWTGAATLTSDATNPQNGLYAMLITVQGTGRDARYNFNAVVGAVYNITIWARRGTTFQSPAFANWIGLSGFATTNIGSQNWTQYSWTVTATSPTPAIRVYAGTIGAASGNSVLIDAVSILPAAPSDTEAPSVPEGLLATNITTSSATVSWSASTDNVGVTGYNIRRNGAVVGTVAGNVLTYNATALTEATTYTFTVSAFDAAGNNSAQSTELDVTTLPIIPDTTAPTVPTGLAASNITTGSATITWNASTDSAGVTGYTIRLNGNVTGTVAGNVLTYNATGLTSETTYTFTVAAFDAAGNNSAQSTGLEVTTLPIIPDTTAPTAPTNLAAINITTTGLTLTWTASTDDRGVTGYTVYRDSIQAGTTEGNSTQFNVNGLTAATSYSFYVTASDSSGNVSVGSTALQVSTSDPAQLITWTSGNSNLSTVNWQSNDLFAAGMVGLGTTPNQNYRLSVNGNIRAKEITVETGWADYVFEPGYDLDSIEEVEAFIKNNGHLKDIPSAAHVEQHGIGLAEMNKKLLQKIEEMTLYIIQSSKRMNELEQQLNELRLQQKSTK